MCNENKSVPIMIRVFEEGYVLNFIESLRKKNKISYAGIGRIVGCNRSMALKLMRGDIKLDLKRAVKLLRYFGYEFLISKVSIDEECSSIKDYELDQEVIEAEIDIMNNPEYKEEDKN